MNSRTMKPELYADVIEEAREKKLQVDKELAIRAKTDEEARNELWTRALPYLIKGLRGCKWMAALENMDEAITLSFLSLESALSTWNPEKGSGFLPWYITKVKLDVFKEARRRIRDDRRELTLGVNEDGEFDTPPPPLEGTESVENEPSSSSLVSFMDTVI